jgi:hypothetical protein
MASESSPAAEAAHFWEAATPKQVVHWKVEETAAAESMDMIKHQ